MSSGPAHLAHSAPGNVLGYEDQALFVGLRATGQVSVVQLVWTYEHPVDMAAIRRFHQNLGHGLLGRRVEPSKLPFGRHRWVASPGPAGPLDVADGVQSRNELADWLNERVRVPVDPEYGPAWHLGVAEFDDGTTAISLVVTHILIDGMGLLRTVAEAAKGTPRDFGFPAPQSRTRVRGVVEDLRETGRSLPETSRALALAAKLAIARRGDIAAGVAKKHVPDGGADVFPPNVTVFVDSDEWDARAAALGATSPHSLVAGFSARLAQKCGRTCADGSVRLNIPIDQRTDDDTRGNAVTLAFAKVDPNPVTTDLSGIRQAIRDARRAVDETPDEMLLLAPLIPFVPKKLAENPDVGIFEEFAVSSTNLGDVDPTCGLADGTPAKHFFARGVDGRVSKEILERRGGYLTVGVVRFSGTVALAIVAYTPGADNSMERLRELVVETFSEFKLACSVL